MAVCGTVADCICSSGSGTAACLVASVSGHSFGSEYVEVPNVKLCHYASVKRKHHYKATVKGSSASIRMALHHGLTLVRSMLDWYYILLIILILIFHS